MSPVDAVSIDPGKAAVFEPGSYHLMLFDAARQFKEGETFPITLTFEKGGALTIMVRVMKGTGMDHSGHSY